MSKDKVNKPIKIKKQLNSRQQMLRSGWFITANIVIVCVIAMFIAYRFYHVKIVFGFAPCFFAEKLHMYCPGCGGTRAVLALLNFRIIRSILCQPMVAYGAGLCTYYYIGAIITIVKNNGKTYCKFKDWTLWLLLIILVVFFIVRNVLLIFWGIDYLGDLREYWV